MKVITIDREYAAGGHSVGRAVAQKLGVEIYDKDIIKHAAQQSGIDPDLVVTDEERISKVGAFLKAISPISYDDKDTIFTFESKVICELASKGTCVVLGRCGKEILEEAGFEVLSVFLHAPEDVRVQRATKLLETDEANARHELRRMDVMRQSYLSYYVNRKQWLDAREYTLSLDTSALSVEACADIICKAFADMQ
jgi:cytidylate kinase